MFLGVRCCHITVVILAVCYMFLASHTSGSFYCTFTSSYTAEMIFSNSDFASGRAYIRPFISYNRTYRYYDGPFRRKTVIYTTLACARSLFGRGLGFPMYWLGQIISTHQIGSSNYFGHGNARVVVRPAKEDDIGRLVISFPAVANTSA